MSTNAITIPEELILSNIELGLEAIKIDFNNAATEQDSFLYRITKNSKLDRYELFQQAKSIFINPPNRNEPKSVQVSMGFNLKRMNEPNIHILMESDQKGKEDGLGMDEGVADNYIDSAVGVGASGTRTNVLTRNFDSRFNIMCSGSNTTELMLIYYVVRNLLYSMESDFHLKGFKNLKITGGSLNPQQQIVDKFYLKSIFMEFDYDVEIPRLWKGSFGNKITITKTIK